LQKVQLHLIAVLLMHGLLLPPIASASLGSDLASVYRDVEHVSGSVQAIDGERYSVYEVRIPTGTIVREFISPSGVVFAVAWQGPLIPELQHFLGAYFQEYRDALHARKPLSFSRRPVMLRLNDLVFENSGHVGAFSGIAYVPQAVPTGVVISELQ
jgi:hypothetical protein